MNGSFLLHSVLSQCSALEKFATSFSLVDLGDENDRNLKMPIERTAETAQETTTQLDEQATTEPAKVKKRTRRKGVNL